MEAGLLGLRLGRVQAAMQCEPARASSAVRSRLTLCCVTQGAEANQPNICRELAQLYSTAVQPTGQDCR